MTHRVHERLCRVSEDRELMEKQLSSQSEKNKTSSESWMVEAGTQKRETIGQLSLNTTFVSAFFVLIFLRLFGCARS